VITVARTFPHISPSHSTGLELCCDKDGGNGFTFRRTDAVGSRDLLQEKLKEILDIAERHGARNVRLFGSVARRDSDDQSDIDLLVDMEPGRSLLDLGGLWHDLNSLLGVKVDVVTENGLKKRIRERVLNEAIPL
jgi:uncharacterized protein